MSKIVLIYRKSRFLAVAGAAIAFIATSVAATEPRLASPETAVRTDRFGDPLPDGAVLRLGTVGFRVPNVAGIGFRPNGELVAFTEDLRLYIWPADGTPKPKITALTEKPQFGWRRALSPNARFAAAFSDQTRTERKITVWDLSGEKPVAHLAREAGDVYTMCFSADGAWLAVNVTQPLDKASLLLCNVLKKTWEELPFAGGYADSLSFAPNGKLLVVTTGQGVSVLDTATRAELIRAKIPKVRPQSAAFSPDGKTIAVLPTTWIHGPEPTVRFLSVASGEEVATMKPPTGSASWLRYSPDGKTLLLGNRHGIREWDSLAGKLLREIDGPASYPAVYSADGRWLASYNRYAVQLWNVEKQRHVRADLIEAGHTDVLLGITVSPDGKLIATNALDGEVRMWAADSGRLLFRVHSAWGNDRRMAFLPGSKSIIVVSDDYVTPVLRDAATGREIRRFAVPADAAKSEMTHDLRLSEDGKILTTTSRPITSSEKGYTVRWDVATGAQIERTERANDRTEDIFPTITSPDGRWTIQSGTLSRPGGKASTTLVPQAESMTMHACFSPDSKLVAVPRTPRPEPGGDRNRGSLVVYNVAAQAPVTELATGRVMRLAFTPDGRELAVVAPEDIALWDVLSGKKVRQYSIKHGIMSQPGAIAFTRDGRRLITGHDDATALIWDLTGIGRANGAAAPELSADAISRQWDALAGDEAAKAYAAAWELIDRGAQTIAFVREHLKPVKAADEALVRRLVAQLDAAAFADRETAAKSLRALEDSAIPTLRATLKAGLPATAAVRVEQMLAQAGAPIPPTESLRPLRAVAILERVGTESACKLLEQLAGGLAEARLTREAVEAMKRLQRRQSPPK